MFKIAICDDEKYFCIQLKNRLEKYCTLNDIEMRIDVYNDGINLLDALNSNDIYDILLLDIKMKELDGIELGTIIREKNQLESTEIILL